MERRARDKDKLALISEEAAEWLVRLRDENLDSTDRLRYAQWLKQSPSHIAEMLRVAGLNEYLDANKLRGVSSSELRSNVIELYGHDGTRNAERHSLAGNRSFKLRWISGLAVAALSMVGVVLFNLLWASSSIDTDSGEWRRVKLSDGSVVNVGPRSHVRFDFSDRTRRDVFLTSGEALFKVAKNSDRPFFVSTDLAVVRAVGTQFGVTRRGNQVSVTVKEGKVAVTHGEVVHLPTGGAAGATTSVENTLVPLVADEQITVTATTWPVKPRRINADRELAWVQGQFFFDETTTVAQAAEEFNRRNRVQIIVDDAEVATRRVCCVFSIDDPESFAQSVANGAHNVRLFREGAVLRLATAHPHGGS